MPHLESRKLAGTLLITEAIEQTMPRGSSSTTIRELARLLGMLRRVLAFIS